MSSIDSMERIARGLGYGTPGPAVARTVRRLADLLRLNRVRPYDFLIYHKVHYTKLNCGCP